MKGYRYYSLIPRKGNGHSPRSPRSASPGTNRRRQRGKVPTTTTNAKGSFSASVDSMNKEGCARRTSTSISSVNVTYGWGRSHSTRVRGSGTRGGTNRDDGARASTSAFFSAIMFSNTRVLPNRNHSKGAMDARGRPRGAIRFSMDNPNNSNINSRKISKELSRRIKGQVRYKLRANERASFSSVGWGVTIGPSFKGSRTVKVLYTRRNSRYRSYKRGLKHGNNGNDSNGTRIRSNSGWGIRRGISRAKDSRRVRQPFKVTSDTRSAKTRIMSRK